MTLKWNFTAVPEEYDPILAECSEPFPSLLSLKLYSQQAVSIYFLPSEKHYSRVGGFLQYFVSKSNPSIISFPF